MSAGKLIPTIADVRRAAERLSGVVRQTPLLSHPELDRLIGVPVFVKSEPLQHTGSFKIRGAYNRLAQLTDDERTRGVVAFSSGNHAQGVARAARLLSVPATIVMPSDAPQVKVDGVLSDGAKIVFYDRFTEDRKAIADKISSEQNLVVVPSYDDFDIISGQGTCGLEITQQYDHVSSPQEVVCGVGGGGLISGLSLAVHDRWPDTRIVGVEPQDFDDHFRSLASGARESNSPAARSACDALLSPSPGELTFAINKHHLSAVARVSDEEAFEAVRFASRYLKLTTEPGGVVSLAALLAGKVAVTTDQPIVIVLTGGNIDPKMLADILSSS